MLNFAKLRIPQFRNKSAIAKLSKSSRLRHSSFLGTAKMFGIWNSKKWSFNFFESCEILTFFESFKMVKNGRKKMIFRTQREFFDTKEEQPAQVILTLKLLYSYSTILSSFWIHSNLFLRTFIITTRDDLMVHFKNLRKKFVMNKLDFFRYRLINFEDKDIHFISHLRYSLFFLRTSI